MRLITNFDFVEDLHLVRRIRGEGNLFEISHDYTVYFDVDGKQEYHTVPAGMKTDLASIPRIVPKWVAQKVDGHIEAAVVHDHMCNIKGPWSSKVAADIFLAGMEAAGIGWFKRKTMYNAVRVFGPQWD